MMSLSVDHYHDEPDEVLNNLNRFIEVERKREPLVTRLCGLPLQKLFSSGMLLLFILLLLLMGSRIHIPAPKSVDTTTSATSETSETPETMEIFGETYRVANMIEMNRYNLKLEGTIPCNEIGLFKTLVLLNLGKNQLSGSLCSELGLLTHLKILNLKDNQFTGSIPSELGLLTHLAELDLHKNKFVGSVPNNLCSKSTNLQSIHVDCEPHPFPIECSCEPQCACQ
ncbi:Leucine Rich Repeat [Seminavis robusta]|uniref:Leucine Rich Repeat n=1 Tax=Seminavis robusta TaxID=568900 RepID=A0A9N8DNG0_9STRA|nr:Leucine Rich Repeat [Seminavis robusta]|eukprot:Sro259_g101230.1 Leucine Rich Repeat (226) ;mRNA; f:5174-5851